MHTTNTATLEDFTAAYYSVGKESGRNEERREERTEREVKDRRRKSAGEQQTKTSFLNLHRRYILEVRQKWQCKKKEPHTHLRTQTCCLYKKKKKIVFSPSKSRGDL